ncbi:hypothetical protein DYB38_013547, partial [Aphanomyces astaci]
MKRLRRTYKVVLNDYKRIRLHQAEAAALPAGAPPLAPLTLDAHPSLGPELTEWLADNRSTEEETAKSIRNGVDELIQLEKTSIARSCALVYASLSPTNIRQLREKHWQGLVTKYPHFLGPAPIAAAAPVHGSTTATATTLLAHWHFRPFAMAQASETATDKRPPYPGALKAKTPWRIGVATAYILPQHLWPRLRIQRSTRLPAWDKAAMPASTTAFIATINAAIARFVSRPPAIAVRSGDRYRDNSEDRVYCRNDHGSFRDDSGANQDDRRHRSRRAPRLRPIGIHPPAHPKPQCVARHC